jgi:hypothetical protein
MFKISTSQEAISDTSGSQIPMSRSGIYPVTIEYASDNPYDSGAASIVFKFVDENNQSRVVYGPLYQNKDKSENTIGARTYKQLGVIVGMQDGESPETEVQTHEVGFPPQPRDLTVITNFQDQAVYVHLQEEKSIYKGELKEEMVIKAFFRAADGASAEEIIKGEDFGKRMKQVEEKYASNITYKDELTPEKVEEMRKAKRDAKSGNKAATPTAIKPPVKKTFGR